jgi:hypothetical protein
MRHMSRPLLKLFLAVAVASCSPAGGLEGTWRGTGSNRLVLRDGEWSLRTGPVLWSGRYRVDGDRVWLETERVVPPEGHETDCDEAPEPYDWSIEGDRLRLRLVPEEPCNQNRRAVLQTAAWTRA